MDSHARATLRDLTLAARRLLTDEARQTLQGVYGLSPKGDFEPEENLPAVRELDEVRETRQRLETLLEDEKDAGLTREEATDELVREVAYTHLNRLVAFKMLEARKLARGTLDKHHASNGFLRFLGDNPEAYDLYNAGDHPQNALGEGPRDIAYRRFLLDRCAGISKEVRVLFDPDDLASRLFPRPGALRTLVEMLNAPEIAAAWSQESGDETLGWVYQYFNEREKAEVFERLYGEKKKIRAKDVPAATQLFTPRWIVRHLVHNTLGRTWVEMHPDSRLADSLEYLVPLEGRESGDGVAPLASGVGNRGGTETASGERSTGSGVKAVREITALDPACGTMHFGLVAFDLFAEMYREEIENAGRPGWPEEPSVTDEAEIPAAILRENLFGMDIDNRAVQLSAMTLYLKAKSMNPESEIKNVNLARADVRFPTGDAADARLEELVRDAGFDRPVYERLFRMVWKSLGNNHVAGSLARAEEEIAKLVEEERRRFDREGREQDIYGDFAGYGEEADKGDFWDSLKAAVLASFDKLAREDETFFVGEVREGLRVLDVMRRHYDVVFTNPPYLAKRNMHKELAEPLDKAYPASKGDFYTAFIERCSEMLDENGGRLGMISQQSFMFISSYEKLRTGLLDTHAIETVCHVGPRAFAEIGGEKVNTVMFVLRREGGERNGDASIGTYFRLTREPDAKAKRLGFERSLATLREEGEAPAVFRYRQRDLRSIPGSPWVYWITPGLRRLFETLPKLKDTSPPRQGLATADNFRFLRYWWEVGENRTARGHADTWEAKESGERWFPYMKGGGFRRWYGNQELVVNWKADGNEIRNFGIDTGKVASRPQNTPFYFQRGITWSDLTTGRFNARLSPGGFIFDVKGSSAFPENPSKVLAILNSGFAHFILSLLNPTASFQVGDLSRLPIPDSSSETLERLVEEAIELSRAESAEDETTYDFVAPPDWRTGPEDVRARRARLAEVEAEIDEEVYRLYGVSGEDRAAIEAELATPTTSDEDGDAPGGDSGSSPPPPGSDPEERRELAARWVSYAVGVVLGRFVPGEGNGGVGRGEFPPEVVEDLVGLVDPDGVATLERDHRDDLAAKVEAALDAILGEDETPRLLEAAGVASGRDGLRRYFERDFFKWHVRMYRKRPVYWLFQSPGKNYGMYLFHERITADTLFLIRGGRYLGGRISRLREAASDLASRAASADEGPEKKRLAKEHASHESHILDLEAMDKELAAINSRQNSRGKTVGWRPEIDDGVIINLAPLHTLMPSWAAEPRKHMAALEAGRYDWSHTAMRYWPDRVIEECRVNKSHAIAHGMMGEYVGKA